MKNFSDRVLRCTRRSFIVPQLFNSVIRHVALIICPLLIIVFLSGCKKENLNTPPGEIQNGNSLTMKSEGSDANNSEGNVVSDYQSLSKQTTWELQQAPGCNCKVPKHKTRDKRWLCRYWCCC